MPEAIKKPELSETFIPFALPEIGDEEINNVVECMRSGWLTSGPKVREFEQKFAEFISSATYPDESDVVTASASKINAPLPEGEGIVAVSVNSATAGLTICLEALGVGEGDEVITSAYTFSASAMSAVYLGATPVLVDIDAATMNINPDLIEAAITKRTKAIIAVHFAGLSCDMDKIIAIAKKHNLKVIEDAAHALPCFYKGKIIGSLDSDATVYSFYATKTITTGEGGMIVTRNAELAARARVMRLHGISTDAFDRYTSTKPKWHYQITAPGYKCNMTDIAAAIGIPQLGKANHFIKKRTYIADKYMEAFKDLPVTLPSTNPCAKKEGTSIHSRHLFVIRIKENCPVSRDEFIKIMSEDYKIGCSVHFIPLNLHPFWQEKLGVNENDFPVSVNAYKNAVSLPIYTKMTEENIHRVITAVREILTKA